jgi:ribonuclease HII
MSKEMPTPLAALIAGVDEAGRGPLAGPVFAAAVILDPGRTISGLADSKKLAASSREVLAPVIRERAFAWGLGLADAEEIDVLNVLGATWLAMRRALLALAVRPAHVRVDGNRCPSGLALGFSCTWQAEVGGDDRVAEISAASILAKTARDAWMRRAAQVYPGYGFERHKGYPTPSHVQALARLGPCRLHRRSFAPVRSLAPLTRAARD